MQIFCCTFVIRKDIHSACRKVAKIRVCQQLHSNKTLLIDLYMLRLKPKVLRKFVVSRAFADAGKTALNRAKLDIEIRHMINTNE